MIETQVLIAGGGPIGLAAAIEARLAGLDAVVVEPRTGAIDKACGEGLMPGAVRALERIGVTPDGHVLRGVEYRDARHSAVHRFTAGDGLGVRRTTLHGDLLARAEHLGVTVLAHPESGRKCLFLSPTYVDRFLGLDQAESDALLRRLTAHMLQPRYVYRHRWRVNDAIVWDNRRFMHAGMGNRPGEPRFGLRTTLAGPLRTGRYFDEDAGRAGGVDGLMGQCFYNSSSP